MLEHTVTHLGMSRRTNELTSILQNSHNPYFMYSLKGYDDVQAYPQVLMLRYFPMELKIAEVHVLVPCKGIQASQQLKQHTAHAEDIS